MELNNKTMIEEKLEIVLVTYNRYKDLDNTLKQFLDGPFSGCKITILDNCSDDKTPEVCAKYQQLFPNLNIIRHVKNIGGNANILRAVETSTSIYTWVICDDDIYDFSDCLDIIDAIDSEKFDLISPGSPGESEWEKGLSTNVKKLLEMGSSYFFARSFVPGTIFKTKLFDSTCLLKGYANMHNLFPYFPFINKSLENNFSIYLSKNKMITPGTHNMAAFSGVYFIAGWINSCSLIKDKNIRKNTVYTHMHGASIIRRIFVSITFEKMSNEKEASKNILSLIFAILLTFGFRKDIFLILLILPLSIIPRFIFRIFLSVYVYLKFDIKNKEMPSEWKYLLSDNKSVDPLRKF